MSNTALKAFYWCLLIGACLTIAASNTIVGGQSTFIKNVPYMVNLRYNGAFLCGGTLVTKRHVVTAAHCVHGIAGRRLLVTAGATFLSDKGKRSRVRKVAIPRGFNFRRLNMDVAVLKLAKPLTGGNIGTLPLCNTKWRPGAVMRVSGWGARTDSLQPSPVLHTVQMPVISRITCARQYRGVQQLTRTMFCLALPGLRDSCYGDSGGPAVYRGQLCGVVSFGRGCADPNYPGVYTDVNKAKIFIQIAAKK